MSQEDVFWTPGCWLMDLRPDWICFGPSHFVGLEPPTLLHGDSSPHSGWTSRAFVGAEPQHPHCVSLASTDRQGQRLQMDCSVDGYRATVGQWLEGSNPTCILLPCKGINYAEGTAASKRLAASSSGTWTAALDRGTA